MIFKNYIDMRERIGQPGPQHMTVDCLLLVLVANTSTFTVFTIMHKVKWGYKLDLK